MFDRSLIGKQYPPVIFPVDAARIRFFAKATGQTDPVYFAESAAQQQGHPSLLAPPTFLTVAGMAQDDPFPHVTDLNVPLSKLLYASQRYCYYAPVYAGDTITLVSEIDDMFDKKAGALQFCVIKQTCTNQQGRLVAVLYGTMVLPS
ncbi:MAG: MaoC family dehydratase [Gammaproteobacteria bacterium]|nr:MaoC family dehydratase [Gammaproteobacteria bacterium]